MSVSKDLLVAGFETTFEIVQFLSGKAYYKMRPNIRNEGFVFIM